MSTARSAPTARWAPPIGLDAADGATARALARATSYPYLPIAAPTSAPGGSAAARAPTARTPRAAAARRRFDWLELAVAGIACLVAVLGFALGRIAFERRQGGPPIAPDVRARGAGASAVNPSPTEPLPERDPRALGEPTPASATESHAAETRAVEEAGPERDAPQALPATARPRPRAERAPRPDAPAPAELETDFRLTETTP
ncbi:MAG: hypothetical protein JNL38_24010 [Myxococcales bacterium]|nr:hypothetical protein [Myxococcales bacterium]